MKILVPVDESPRSVHLIDFLAGRKVDGEQPFEVELLNVQFRPTEAVWRVYGEEPVKKAFLEEGEKIFELLRPIAEAKGLRVTTKTIVGDGGQAVKAEAEAFGADLIVMGSRGLGPVKGFILGSFTNAALAQTKTPVLLIRDETKDIPSGKLRIGVAVDGSAYGRAAADFVIANAPLMGEGTEFAVLNVADGFSRTAGEASDPMSEVPPLPFSKGFEAMLDKRFAETVEPVVEAFRAANLPVKALRLKGLPGDALAEYAQGNLDILVLGSHGRGNFRAAVMGSVSMHVAAKTQLPILVIPSGS